MSFILELNDFIHVCKSNMINIKEIKFDEESFMRIVSELEQVNYIGTDKKITIHSAKFMDIKITKE